VCAWAFVAVKVDAFVLLRPAHVRPVDMPTVVTSWWSPAARHLLAHQVTAGRLVLPAGPGVIQATMAALALIPAGLVVWVRCGCPVPAPVRAWLQTRARVAMARVPTPIHAVMGRGTSALPVPARETAMARAALLPSTSTVTPRPRVAALPAPTRTPSSTVVPPLRFIHPAQPAPRDAVPAPSITATSASTMRAGARRR